MGFLAKNQLPSKAPDSIIIPRLSNYCKSDNFNGMLCPVRAVKICLKRTKSLRKHRKRLFIPIRGDQDLAKSTLSRWVRYVIKHAYSSISKNQNRLLKPELTSSGLSLHLGLMRIIFRLRKFLSPQSGPALLSSPHTI